MTYYGLRISEYRASRACTLCLGTETAGVSVRPGHRGGRAVDEYNLNVVDCNVSVTVARRSYISVEGSWKKCEEANIRLPGGLLKTLR
jgi:hypothetical protein